MSHLVYCILKMRKNNHGIFGESASKYYGTTVGHKISSIRIVNVAGVGLIPCVEHQMRHQISK